MDGNKFSLHSFTLSREISQLLPRRKWEVMEQFVITSHHIQPMTGGFVGHFLSSTLAVLSWLTNGSVFGGLRVPVGMCWVLRYELRICQILCWIKAAVTVALSGKTKYRLSHLACWLLLLQKLKPAPTSLLSLSSHYFLYVLLLLYTPLLSSHLFGSFSFTTSYTLNLKWEIREY